MKLKTPKKENMIALLLFTMIMMLKICSVIVLCSKLHESDPIHHDKYAHHTIKENKTFA